MQVLFCLSKDKLGYGIKIMAHHTRISHDAQWDISFAYSYPLSFLQW